MPKYPVVMPFENKKGQITVDDKYVIAFFSDNEHRSYKVPKTVTTEPNIKTLHDVLKMANLAKYYLTDKGLETFDELVEEWKDETGT